MKAKFLGPRPVLILDDVRIILITTIVVLLLDSVLDPWHILINCAVQLVVVLACRFAFRVYSTDWKQAGLRPYFLFIFSDILSWGISTIALRFTPYYMGWLPGITVSAWGATIALVWRMTYPLKYRFLQKEHAPKTIPDSHIDHLLSRDDAPLYSPETIDAYRDKVVLVTGGGGSIGSEICRQIAALHPGQLIIFDIYENNAYDIQQELIRKYGADLNLAVEIGSVRDRDRLEALFNEYRPGIVIHAAAHKHVPLMEHSCCEAIKNNVVGTYNTADMAEKYGVDRFVLISTDKAVNPTSVMGASKRVCEMIVSCRSDSSTVFSAVRFGNVLGSNGSVVPLFEKQISEGGPVTITDRRMVRYFMTIKEAAQLVLEAGSIANQGDLFVLDMGKPIRILDLAEKMIRQAGLKPYRDIDIKEIGLRPGEKLYEESLTGGQNQTATCNDRIFVEQDEAFTRDRVDEYMDMLMEAVAREEQGVGSTGVRDVLGMIVPTYRDPEQHSTT